MAQAKDLLKNRGTDQIFYTNPDAMVNSAIGLMAEKNVGALLVKNATDAIVGIVTERDVLLKVAAREKNPKSTAVSEIMTEKVYRVQSKQSLEDCMEIMNKNGFRHLPVFEGEELLGMISVKDVLRQVIAEQRNIIGHLEDYITGN
ncbi:MAG TPA: CBS domain-containing protein [Anaerolineales bacterium]|nr:CBS domain-containing protein [Anaerolineales bacterium]